MEASKDTANHQEFIQNLKKINSANPTWTKIRVRLRKRIKQRYTIEELHQRLEKNLRSNASKISFNLIKRLTIINPAKRDGGIVTCLYDAEENFTAVNERIQDSCLEFMEGISKRTPQHLVEDQEKQPFPSLKPLTRAQVVAIQALLPVNKGITMDGLSDTFLKKTEKRELLQDWWNDSTIRALGEPSFEARLIPLNKVHPKIPKIHQFRPIIVLSAGYKLIEARFLPKLKKYMSNKMDKNQIGFVVKSETSMNILALIHEIQKY